MSQQDIAWLESVLGNLKEATKIEGYNHMDFILVYRCVTVFFSKGLTLKKHKFFK